jgi:PAS domain S-box-containing protein
MDETARTPSEERDLFRSLVDHSLGLMCVHDLEGNLLFVNTAAAETLGFRPEDGIGWNLRRFLSPAAEDEFDAYLERIRANGVDSGRMSLMSKEGGERIWQYRNVLHEVPGMPARVLGHAQDVTESVRAVQGPQGERAALPAPREYDAGPHLDVGPERLMHLREPALARFHRAAGGGASRRRVDR